MIQRTVDLRLTKITQLEAEVMSRTGLYIVASSFEPRSVQTTQLIPTGVLQDAVVISYEDTLDPVMGRHHLMQIRETLNSIGVRNVSVLRCRFSDPYSLVRAFHAFVRARQFRSGLDTVTIDTTCITKIHLLLLLQYLHERMQVLTVNILYTAPLVYATAFGKQLSYGIDRTVYLPYQPRIQHSYRAGLVAFLGCERMRLDRIVEELGPSTSVIILGNLSCSGGMFDDSKRIYASLVHMSSYDSRYRIAEAPSNDIRASVDVLVDQIQQIQGLGCDTIYFVPLGTKLQALSIDIVRRMDLPVRMLLAYSTPRTYEASMYSRGIGPTYISQMFNRVES